MRLKNPPLSVKNDAPFEDDALNRNENVEALTQLVSTFREPMVISIDSPWGTGKTTFIKMWRQHLINNGFLTLYFNAWENDFSDDALVSLIGEIGSGLKDFQITGNQKNRAKTIFNKTKKIGVEILKKSIPLALRTATAGFLDINEDVEKALSELTEQIAEDKIKDYEEAKKTITNFKNQLSKFAETISEKDETVERKPLVFFIDELDRCRPTYAIELLEKAKHLFNVDGIVFVLAVDKDQLGHSIKSVYGTGMDVDGYLRRFIDLTYHLPEPSKGQFCSYLFERFCIKDYLENQKRDFGETREPLGDIFTELFLLFKFSLRKQEQCFSQLSIVLRTIPSNRKIFPYLLGILIVLRSVNPDLYKRFVNKECSVEDVLNFVKEKNGGKRFLNDRIGEIFEAFLISAHYDESDTGKEINSNSIIERYKKITAKEDGDVYPNNPEKKRAEFIYKYFEHIRLKRLVGHSGEALRYLVKKIELTDRFEH